VQAIVRELQGEKIDIVPWREDPAAFVKAALAPADVQNVSADSETRTLKVLVADDQLSLAIGSEGRTPGWRPSWSAGRWTSRALRAAAGGRGDPHHLDGRRGAPRAGRGPRHRRRPQAVHRPARCGEKLAARLVAAGYVGLAMLADAKVEALQEIDGIGPKSGERILQVAREAMAKLGPVRPNPTGIPSSTRPRRRVRVTWRRIRRRPRSRVEPASAAGPCGSSVGCCG